MIMRQTGNKGEWSEFYAFLRLLFLGKLYAADENAHRIDNIFLPIIKIIREEGGKIREYIINQESGDVSVVTEGITEKTILHSYLSVASDYLYKMIDRGSERTFEINDAPAIMSNLNLSRIVAPSSDKTDIVMLLHDIFTGYDRLCGFSIKSELGSPPTLLNASRATNFIYEVTGLTALDMARINNINTQSKIIDRIAEIRSCGLIKYHSLCNAVFSSNLMLLDTNMESILSWMLLYYYQNQANDCKTLVKILEKENPLKYPRKGFYEYKFKKFLCSIALGMVPSKEWNGYDEANGGYVIVKQDGEVLAYHLYNRNAFETYLLNNTRFERGSTSRHDFASLYTQNEKMYINLNLQIRFI